MNRSLIVRCRALEVVLAPPDPVMLARLRARGPAVIVLHELLMILEHVAVWFEVLCRPIALRLHRAWQAWFAVPGEISGSSGRRRLDPEIVEAIFFMWQVARLGARKIHEHLRLLDINVSYRTVARYLALIRFYGTPRHLRKIVWTTSILARRSRDLAHRFYAVDFTQIKAARGQVLYIMAVLHEGSRRVVRAVATHIPPTAEWTREVLQHIFESLPAVDRPRFLVMDNGPQFRGRVRATLRKECNVVPIRIAPYRPWMNPFIERWWGTVKPVLRRARIQDVVQLQAWLDEFLVYYHCCRPHSGLAGDTPDSRPITPRPSPTAKLVAVPYCGGLVHDFVWQRAA
jgi:putative transposase